MLKRRRLILYLLVLMATAIGFIATQTRAAGDLSPKEARRLIARMAGIELPSDAVRIKEISSFGNSATVVAQIETAFRLVKAIRTNGGWQRFAPETGAGKMLRCSYAR